MVAQVSPLVSAGSKISSKISSAERFAFVPASVIQSLSSRVSPGAFVVYVALASFANRNGYCWPSRRTLAAMTRFTVNYISQVTRELEEAGFLRKEPSEDGKTVYRLTVIPLQRSDPPPTPQRSTSLRHGVDRTQQVTPQETERAPEPAPVQGTAPEPEPTTTLSLSKIEPKAPLPEGWTLPKCWRDAAVRQRPDLAERLDEIAANFVDYHTSKGTRSGCWLAEWRRWIRREYGPKAAINPFRGAQMSGATVRRYPTREQEQAPLPAVVRAAMTASEQRRLEQLRAFGIDPATGGWLDQKMMR